MGVGDSVRWARTQQGMTQRELAACIRVRHHRTTDSYISRIESGAIDPRASTLCAIARALRLQPWMLFADLQNNPAFWADYLGLSGEKKREVQRILRRMSQRD